MIKVLQNAAKCIVIFGFLLAFILTKALATPSLIDNTNAKAVYYTYGYSGSDASAKQLNLNTPIISWVTPSSITYGTQLTGTQLNATASYNSLSVSGNFTYSPAAGSILNVGTQTLNTTFTRKCSV